jgi:hypothetical protein
MGSSSEEKALEDRKQALSEAILKEREAAKRGFRREAGEALSRELHWCGT